MNGPKKRPRPTLSCRECRAKKLRCDRAQPCQQCVRGEREDQCTYDSALPGTNDDAQNSTTQRQPACPTLSTSSERRPRSSDPPPPPLPQLQAKSGGVVEDLQARVAALEDIIHSGAGHASAAQTQCNRRRGQLSVNHSQDQNQGRSHAQKPVDTLSVKGERCRYYGLDYQCGLFERVRNFAVSMLQPSADVRLWEMAKDVQRLVKLLQGAAKRDDAPSSLQEPLLTSDAALARMRETLPEKAVCDSLLEAYFSMFEERLIILHESSFRPLYEAYMENREQPLGDHVVPQTHAAMALAAYQIRDSYSRQQAAAKEWLHTSPIEAIEAWLDRLPRKSRTKIQTLQTRALYILIGKARGLPIEEHWQETNALVRSAMAMGLHRGSEQLHIFPPLQADLRRRLWHTIVEIDLQASIRYGMPPAVRSEDTDCLPSGKDEAADASADLRSSLSTDEPGPVLQGAVLYSLHSRLTIANTICRPLDPSSRATVSQLLDEVDSTMREFGRLLDLNLRRWCAGALLSISAHNVYHSTLLMSAQRAFSTEAGLEVAALKGAVVILSVVNELASRSQTDASFQPFQNLFYAEFMHDILKAAAVASMYLEAGCTRFSAAEMFGLLGNALEALEENAVFQIGNIKNILALSISIHLAKARYNGEDERESIRKGLIQTLSTMQMALLKKTKAKGIRAYPKVATPEPQRNDLTSLDNPLDIDNEFLQSLCQWESPDWLLDIDQSWL